MKKTMIGLVCLGMLLGGCSDQKKNTSSDNADYNQYLHSAHVALTDQNAVFTDGTRLFYTDYGQLKEPEYLCFDSSCSHRDAECSSYIGGDGVVQVFGSDENLYYTYLENGINSFYRMTYKAENKEKLFDLPYYSANSPYHVSFSDPYICIVSSSKEISSGKGGVLVRDINAENGEWKCIFDGDESHSYIYAFVRDGWCFAAYNITDDKFGLDAYRLSDEKYVHVTDEWDRLRMDDIVVEEDHFTWTKMEDGFYTNGFDDQEAEKISSLEKGVDQSQTFADDEFFYLINTSGQIDSIFDVPEEEKGLKIYDRKGNLLINFSLEDLGMRPWYAFSEDDRIVFADSDKSYKYSYEYPGFYIYREDIRNGKAEIHLISE